MERRLKYRGEQQAKGRCGRKTHLWTVPGQQSLDNEPKLGSRLSAGSQMKGSPKPPASPGQGQSPRHPWFSVGTENFTSYTSPTQLSLPFSGPQRVPKDIHLFSPWSWGPQAMLASAPTQVQAVRSSNKDIFRPSYGERRDVSRPRGSWP